jgi:hypothetical protein
LGLGIVADVVPDLMDVAEWDEGERSTNQMGGKRGYDVGDIEGK